MGTTIRDVARAAEVSIGTVSRALKNQPGLSEATRAARPPAADSGRRARRAVVPRAVRDGEKRGRRRRSVTVVRPRGYGS